VSIANTSDIYSAVPTNLDLPVCPHCGISRPLLVKWSIEPDRSLFTDKQSDTTFWEMYECSRCRDIVSTKWAYYRGAARTIEFRLLGCFPSVRKASSELPDRVRRFLEQAFRSLHAPDAAILTAASAIDAMLKEKEIQDGSLYARLKQAASAGVITEDMRAWADHVRLEANDGRHVDEEATPPTEAQAAACVQFAKALADVLFVLPARVSRGIQQADRASAAGPRADDAKQT
jgi:hypothetical protein